jgi:hypothetical protein
MEDHFVVSMASTSASNSTKRSGNFFKVGLKAALHQGNNWQHVACNIFKAGFTPSQQLATCCLQHFLVMLPVITKKCCWQHVANCCLGVRPPLVMTGNMLPIVALV